MGTGNKMLDKHPIPGSTNTFSQQKPDKLQQCGPVPDLGEASVTPALRAATSLCILTEQYLQLLDLHSDCDAFSSPSVQSMAFILILLMTFMYIFAVAGTVMFASYSNSERTDLKYKQSFRYPEMYKSLAKTMILLIYLYELI